MYQMYHILLHYILNYAQFTNQLYVSHNIPTTILIINICAILYDTLKINNYKIIYMIHYNIIY